MSDTGRPYNDPPQPAEMNPGAGIESRLDRPLSDRSFETQIPEHVKSLMGRMSRGKVYLLEESTGIIHYNESGRSRRDPVHSLSLFQLRELIQGQRIAALVEMLDVQDPTAWLSAPFRLRYSTGIDEPIDSVAASEGSASPIRPNTLFIRSDIIKHLSTDKVFSYATAIGAGVLGKHSPHLDVSVAALHSASLSV